MESTGMRRRGFAVVAAFLLLFCQEAIAQQCQPVPHAFAEHVALNQFWGTHIPLCRLPGGTGNAYANGTDTAVFADQDWLDSMAIAYGPFAATGILAHEWGHIVQGQVVGTAAELQADCLAGVFMRGAGLPWQTVEQFALANFHAGDHRWTPNGHGTGAQRVNAARRGYNGFAYQTGGALAMLCPLSAF